MPANWRRSSESQPRIITIAVNTNTNRISSAGPDASGKMTSWGGNSYAYDTGNSMVKQTDPQGRRWYFLYTFSGERIATIDWQGSIATREVDGPSAARATRCSRPSS